MKAKPTCPHCSSIKTSCSGKYKRKRSRQLIQRYKCSNCKHTFSDQTLSKTYKQKRPDLNKNILEMVSGGVGVRKTAMLLRTTKNTVQKRIKFLAEVCDAFNKKHMSEWDIKPPFQFDEMETFEHSRHANLGVPVLVEKKSHFIVGAIGQYATSKSHYPDLQSKHNVAHSKEISGKDRITKELIKLCRVMKPQGRIIIDTDGHRSYPAYMKEAFKNDFVHNVYVAGDDRNKTELFPVNNICGCLRDDEAMLRRRTWHVCKDKNMLTARLKIYTFFSNFLKKKTYTQTWVGEDGV